MMRSSRDRLDSESDWDSPSEHAGPITPRMSDVGGDSIATEHSESYRPKPRTSRSHFNEAPIINGNDVAPHDEEDEDSFSDVLQAAKVNANPAYEPDVDPPHDFREALGSTDSLRADPVVEVREPRRSVREPLYEEVPSPIRSQKTSIVSADARRKRKKKKISFDLASSEQGSTGPTFHRERDQHFDSQYDNYSDVPPPDFDHNDSVPNIRMEPIAERAESLLRRGYREAMTVIGILFSFFMVFLEELMRILALKIFSPILHMVRYFLMAVLQLLLDLIEFFVIGLRRIALPLYESIDVCVQRCCLPLLRAFRPINISFVTTAPIPQKVERGSYIEA